MDYGMEVGKMLEHLNEEPTPDQLAYFVRALSFGIAQASTFVTTKDVQRKLLNCVIDAIRSEAEIAFNEVHPMTDEEFLRDHFNPGKFNG
jgi:hypothetical protein